MTTTEQSATSRVRYREGQPLRAGDLTAEQATWAMGEILSGEATPAQIADPPSQRCVKWGPASRLPTLTPPYALTSSRAISRSSPQGSALRTFSCSPIGSIRPIFTR